MFDSTHTTHYNTHMNQEIDPMDDIQCEEFVPEFWEGSPEPEPLSEADMERQAEEYFDWLAGARTGE